MNTTTQKKKHYIKFEDIVLEPGRGLVQSSNPQCKTYNRLCQFFFNLFVKVEVHPIITRRSFLKKFPKDGYESVTNFFIE